MSAQSETPAPRLALAIATSLGLGYIPFAPGTWGSAAGVALAVGLAVFTRPLGAAAALAAAFAFAAIVAVAGVWAGSRAALFARSDDPQFVVIDEVSGQIIALVGGSALATLASTLGIGEQSVASSPLARDLLDWKYLMAGFIIFRVFDIWKPFPARQAELLHGGLGIMADDWIAGAYTALALCLARYWGL
jgi:phosphatidylglycerophosphatase A